MILVWAFPIITSISLGRSSLLLHWTHETTGSRQPTANMAPTRPQSPHQESPPQTQTARIVCSTPLEVRSSELQRVWTKAMAAGPYKGSSSYKKISVLTISWDPKFDDMGMEYRTKSAGCQRFSERISTIRLRILFLMILAILKCHWTWK